MKVEAHTIKGRNVAEIISDDVIIKTVEDGLDLMGNMYYQGFDKIILQEKHLAPDFFNLKSGMAGEILQKFSNYRIQLSIVGDFEQYTSKSLQDFIRESNKGKLINFVASKALALL